MRYRGWAIGRRWIIGAICSVLVAIAVDARAAAPQWAVQPSSTLTFTFTQTGAKLPGRFDTFEARILFDPDNLAESAIDVTIDTNSIDTDNSNRDTTLRSPELFHTDGWPTARFQATEILATPNGYEAAGKLTIRDVTRPETLPFTLEIDGNRAKARGTLTISRTAYGVGQGQWAGTDIVADEVTINVAIDAVRQP